MEINSLNFDEKRRLIGNLRIGKGETPDDALRDFAEKYYTK